MQINRPPYNEKDLTSQPWQKWFADIYTCLTKFYTKQNIVVDTSSKGLVLKSANGHYWRLVVDNSGILTTTDLGTNLP